MTEAATSTLSLSKDSCHLAIDKVLAAESSDVELRRTTDLASIGSFADAQEPKNLPSSLDLRTHFYFGIQALNSEAVVGFCTFYIAYSTWDGRMLYGDHIHPESKDSLLLYRILAKIATELGCSRFTWKQTKRPEWDIGMGHPEFLEDWIFLSMDRASMARFVGACPSPSRHGEFNDMKLKFFHIEDTIRESLIEQKGPENVHLRLAEAEDTETIARLVQGLAIFEKEPDAVNITAKDYYIDGYSSTEPLFYCILADVTDSQETTTTAAMGLFYFGHDLLRGPFLYLEDLYCEEAYRGKGIGTAIMKQLARISLAMDCRNFVWTALDWNAPALAFYQKIGATRQTELKITRYCGKDIQAFAQSKDKK